MKEKVRSWLNDRHADYWQGVALYDELGSNEYFKKLSRKRDSAFNRKRLHELLGEVYDAWDVPEVQIQDVIIADKGESANEIRAKQSTNIPANDFTPDQLELIEASKLAANKQYKVFMNKRAQLLALCPLKEDRRENLKARVEARYKIVQEMVPLRKTSDKLYTDYHYAKKHGKLPDTPAPVVKKRSPVQLEKARTNLMKSISHHQRHKDQSPNRLNRIAQKKLELKLVEDELSKLE